MSVIEPGDHTLELLSSVDGLRQPFRLFVPEAAGAATVDRPMPLAVVLHGKGVDHNAWFFFTPIRSAAQRHGYVVAGPKGRGERYYDGAGEQDVLDIIKLVKSQLRIDDDRVYLAGHSMGGWGAWYIGLRHAELFGAICPMAAVSAAEPIEQAGILAPLIIHDADDETVPVERSREPAARLAELGLEHEYIETTGYGHSSRLIGDHLDRMFEWFDRHPRASR